MKPLIFLVCFISVFLFSGCRAEIHEVLEEYKEGAAKFIGKMCIFACMSGEIMQVDLTGEFLGGTVGRKM